MKRISTLGVLTLVVLAGVLGLKVRAAFAENIIENIGGVQALPVVSYVTSSSNETSRKVTKTIPVSLPITKVVNTTSADIYCGTGTSRIKVSGPSSEINKLEVTQVGGAVGIRLKKDVKYANLRDVRIEITAENLSSVNSKGSGDIIAKELESSLCEMRSQGSGDIRVENVEASVAQIVSQGSGEITISKLMATNVKIQIQGSGDLSIGSAESTAFSTYVQGSGDIDVSKVTSTQVDITSQGSGDADIQLEASRVNVICQGSGDVRLRGAVTSVKVIKQGSGTVNTNGLKTSRVLIQ
ncbi:MAG: DUF2807 domain-containing protein [Muribaculaceae bacterium]|nr:DUF2807 domain-containing protein [Muribaculaceae bacterium]